ncbi:hypothetical protein XELAEV_18032411mg [Xenopus laevis]|uniref:Uncharacterized protein n=1 Tax=Xenopus laevis TaxID=8355 RepID=A0A974CPH4_XENLA|nr:hypothetical protein XELAEV_18032411mg [Xenopus laevis]
MTYYLCATLVCAGLSKRKCTKRRPLKKQNLLWQKRCLKRNQNLQKSLRKNLPRNLLLKLGKRSSKFPNPKFRTLLCLLLEG